MNLTPLGPRTVGYHAPKRVARNPALVIALHGGGGSAALDPYDHLPIQQTESWWRAQGASVVTRYGDWGH